MTKRIFIREKNIKNFFKWVISCKIARNAVTNWGKGILPLKASVHPPIKRALSEMGEEP